MIVRFFEKKLLFLIPFYIFKHESRFGEYEKDEEKLETLKQKYKEIKERVEQFVIQGEISEYTRRTILEMSGKVLVHIADGHEAIKEGVKPIMVGEVLDYEAKRILRQGMEQGRSDGLREGREEGIKKMVSALRKLGIPLEMILEQIQEEYHLNLKEAQKYL